MLMICKMSSTSYSTAPIDTWSLSAGLASLLNPAVETVSRVCFSEPEQQKANTFLHALIAL